MAGENLQQTGLDQQPPPPPPPAAAAEPVNRQQTGPKTSWPELVGMDVEEAQRMIKQDMPMVRFQVVPPNNFVTMDFHQMRVRLYIDSSNKVARPPRLG